MAQFTVLKQVDAWVNYETIVEAESAEEATKLAQLNEHEYTWTGGEAGDVQEYDHREFYTLDDEGRQVSQQNLEMLRIIVK